MPVHLAIVEPDAAGHHLALHVRALVAEAARRGWRVHLLTTAAAMQHPAYEIARREAGGALATSSLVGDVGGRDGRFLAGLRLELRRWRAFRAATADVLEPLGVDAVYVTSLERTARAIALLGSPFHRLPFVGLYNKVRFHHRRMGVRSRMGPRARLIETALFPRLLAIPTLRAVPVIDEPFLDWARTRRAPGWRKIVLVPDASGLHGTMARDEARAQLGIVPEHTVVLLYGALERRKGVAELLAAAADPRLPGKVAVLVAGMQDAFTECVLVGETAARLRGERRLFEEPGFLDDVREQRAFAAADVVWLGYRDFDAGSAVLVQAGAVGLPCLATDRGLIALRVERHGLGLTVDTGDHDAVVAALARLISDRALRRGCEERGRSFAASRTPGHFARAVCDLVADAEDGASTRAASA